MVSSFTEALKQAKLCHSSGLLKTGRIMQTYHRLHVVQRQAETIVVDWVETYVLPKMKTRDKGAPSLNVPFRDIGHAIVELQSDTIIEIMEKLGMFCQVKNNYIEEK
eukprot:gene22112-8689_t